MRDPLNVESELLLLARTETRFLVSLWACLPLWLTRFQWRLQSKVWLRALVHQVLKAYCPMLTHELELTKALLIHSGAKTSHTFASTIRSWLIPIHFPLISPQLAITSWYWLRSATLSWAKRHIMYSHRPSHPDNMQASVKLWSKNWDCEASVGVPALIFYLGGEDTQIWVET